jgi:hypothetical protein
MVVVTLAAIQAPIIKRAVRVFQHFGHHFDLQRVKLKPNFRPISRFPDPNINLAVGPNKGQKVYCAGYASVCTVCSVNLGMQESPFEHEWAFSINELVLRDYSEDEQLNTELHRRYPGLVCPRLRNFL